MQNFIHLSIKNRMKFIVFGGTGFVGSKLVRHIRGQGGEVLAVSRSGDDDSLSLDITEQSQFSKIDFEPDVIINCASRIPAKGKKSTDPDFLKELFLTNVTGAANIANWAVKNGIPKLINCSTLVVVKKPWPEPLTEEFFALPEGFHVGYAMSKLSQEQIMHQCVSESDTKLVHVRLSAVYGPGMPAEGIIFSILENLVQDKDVNLTDAKINSLDLIHVEDVNRALYALGVNAYDEKVINLASGKEVSVYGLAETLKKITGSNSVINNSDTGNLPSRAVIDIEKLKKNIGSVYNDFVPLEEGLKEIAGKYRILKTDEVQG